MRMHTISTILSFDFTYSIRSRLKPPFRLMYLISIIKFANTQRTFNSKVSVWLSGHICVKSAIIKEIGASVIISVSRRANGRAGWMIVANWCKKISEVEIGCFYVHWIISNALLIYRIKFLTKLNTYSSPNNGRIILSAKSFFESNVCLSTCWFLLLLLTTRNTFPIYNLSLNIYYYSQIGPIPLTNNLSKPMYLTTKFWLPSPTYVQSLAWIALFREVQFIIKAPTSRWYLL